MNDRDTEFIAGVFIDRGYKLAESPEKADVVLFNTCSVREHAEERAINSMGQLLHVTYRKSQRTSYKPKVFGITGCMAQAMKEKLFERLPDLNLVCGTGEIARLPELVEDAEKTKIIATKNIDGHIPEIDPEYRENTKHAYVSIMRGCNNFCSYCIVPYVRGKERSRVTRDIIKEIEGLLKRGIGDVTLLGQNVNSYKGLITGCKRQDKKCDFVELLKIINSIPGIKQIRFLTSHPKDANRELFKAMRDLEKVVKHLHLPLQSGSDRILKSMNRGYTRKKYLTLIKEARELIPSLRLTTDIIVGFPTEKEKDFKDTLDVVRKIEFNFAYIFKYSPRDGTKAARMKDDVSLETKKKRHKILLDLQRSISGKKRKN